MLKFMNLNKMDRRKSAKYLGNSGSNDPMYEELHTNILTLEIDLKKLREQVTEFSSGAEALCASAMRVSEALMAVCSPDPSLCRDSFKYRCAISSIAVSDAAGSSVIARLAERLYFEVVDPIDLYLDGIENIKLEMKELTKVEANYVNISLKYDKIKAKQNPNPDQLAKIEQEYNTQRIITQKLSDRVVEELKAFYKHRFDVLRGPYRGLKRCQHEFFQSSAASLADTMKAPENIDAPQLISEGLSPDILELRIKETFGSSGDTLRRKRNDEIRRKSSVDGASSTTTTTVSRHISIDVHTNASSGLKDISDRGIAEGNDKKSNLKPKHGDTAHPDAIIKIVPSMTSDISTSKKLSKDKLMQKELKSPRNRKDFPDPDEIITIVPLNVTKDTKDKPDKQKEGLKGIDINSGTKKRDYFAPERRKIQTGVLTMSICPKCGALSSKPNPKFCTACGNKFNKVENEVKSIKSKEQEVVAAVSKEHEAVSKDGCNQTEISVILEEEGYDTIVEEEPSVSLTRAITSSSSSSSSSSSVDSPIAVSNDHTEDTTDAVISTAIISETTPVIKEDTIVDSTTDIETENISVVVEPPVIRKKSSDLCIALAAPVEITTTTTNISTTNNKNKKKKKKKKRN